MVGKLASYMIYWLNVLVASGLSTSEAMQSTPMAMWRDQTPHGQLDTSKDAGPSLSAGIS